MKAILAKNNLGFIGLNGGLPWRSKSDFRHFKEMTIGQKLLVGYNTFSTLPKLKDREVILDIHINSAFHYLDSPEKISMAEERKLLLGTIDWCIGGKKTYEKYAPIFTELHISHINDNTIGDTLFPDLSRLNKDCKIFNYYFDVD